MSKTISLNQPILSANDLLAQRIRRQLDVHQILGVNIMASPGAGKTSLILKTIEALKAKTQIAVIEGDVVDIDVDKVKNHGIPVVLANTGGNCHLDAVMVQKALKKIDLKKIKLLILENVGNLICPMVFKLGTHINVVIGSVPEGADKPYKYPGMFKGADVVILNKIDYLKSEDFDLRYFKQGVFRSNPDCQIILVSCKTNKGLDTWFSWLQLKLP